VRDFSGGRLVTDYALNMSDPLRTDSIAPPSQEQIDAERDAKIESLLLAGLDHYFASDYAQAIDVWSRALFLDRNHARARAYIERARSALGEQQREAEELIHNGVAAFERGEMEAARQLLNAAVQRGGAHEVALAFLTRIDRMSAVSAAAPSVPVAAPAKVPSRLSTVPAPRGRGRVIGAMTALAAVVLVAIAWTSWDRVSALVQYVALGSANRVDPLAVRPVPEAVTIPLSSETAFERGQALFRSGRLYDAVRALDLVRATDPRRPQADELKAVIQRELLAHAQTGASSTR
jgi:tetratricopeptide (TPR) repeat protein